jgi:hypothetical protein
LGFSQDHSNATIRYLFDRKCIEAKMPGDEWSDSNDTIKITSLGRYHAVSLVKTFNYMDAVTVDTPVIDDSVRQKIQDVFPIRERLERCKLFLRYLDDSSRTMNDSQILQAPAATGVDPSVSCAAPSLRKCKIQNAN